MLIRQLRVLALLLFVPWALPASADVIDISQKPLIVANPDAVKANLLFILDDSGSMNFDFLPDHINTSLCRSTGATSADSGKFTNKCCINGGSDACYMQTPLNMPFGTARGQAPFLAAGFNGAAYDPNISYKPPVKADGTLWPSQTSGNTNKWTAVKNDAYNIQNTATLDLTKDFPDTEWCVDDGTFKDCLRNDNYVLPGTVGGKAYTRFNATSATDSGKVATGAPDNASTATRDFGPHYYTIHAAEYCSGPDLRDCQPTPDAGHSVPAPVRWCNTDANARKSTPDAASCQAIRNDSFTFARYPTKFFTAGIAYFAGKGSSMTFKVTLTCATNKTAALASLKIGGVEMLTGATGTTNSATTMASNIAGKFNTSTGWTVKASSANVTITAPVSDGDRGGTYATLTATSASNCATFTPTGSVGPFASDYQPKVDATFGSYGGRFERVDITPGTSNAPNTFARPSTRTDCAAIASSNKAGTCSYAEEMTNFANWWTYYHSRMQAMKSSASLAFGDVGSNRRVGYMSINSNTGSDFLNLNTFEGTQRTSWFNKLTAAKPNNSTPLKAALSTAGRLYAGVYNKGKINSVTVTEPMEYSCQRNAVILSTDGFWNESTTALRPDGTEIGDVDSSAAVTARPKYDGTATGNTLADVAYYYANNDLRVDGTKYGGNSVCLNTTTNADLCNDSHSQNSKQTVMTFTLGLGVSGWMQFAETYLTGGSPDYTAVANGDPAIPSSGTCSWQTSGACNWPVPKNNTLTAVDDLWHAAVNGGGTYFSASNPQQLYKGLTNALKQFDGKLGAAAAATTSNPNVTAGDNQAFVSDFTSSDWYGELTSKLINLDTGKLDTVAWSAQAKLDAAGSRKIYMFSSSAADKLKEFSWSLLSGDEQKFFQKAWITTSGRALTQFCTGPVYCLTSADQDLASGEKLVNFLRGDRSNEGDLDTASKYYRARKHLLGDIVASEAVYVKTQLVKYGDTGYAEYNAKPRTAMVYVGANDGMLHAFNAETGDEVWAYMPSAVLPNLYKLADKQYATNHQYFVDATPFVQDVKIGTEWRTILVGGMGAGGRAYYALDVTDPAAPRALWEFGVGAADTAANCPSTTPRCNMGYTFGQPEIGKLISGDWVVVLPSGYNNVSPGDGKGRLFVLNAATGALVSSMSSGIVTTAGSTTTPAGLGHIRAWVDDGTVDNTIKRVYGGDNLGNVWRFDVNNTIGAAGYDAQLLGVLKNAAGTLQPVTSRPELGQVSEYAMVYVGTGRYMGTSDLSDTSVQSVYAIKDALKATGHGEVRAGSNFVQQQFPAAGSPKQTCPTGTAWCTAGQTVRTTQTVNTVNLADKGGWFIDLPVSRERVNNDPLLALGTLIVISNVIQPGDVCSAGGSSWVNYFDYTTGQASSVPLGDVLASRPTIYRLPNQKLVGLARGSSGADIYFDPPSGPQVGNTRRVSWRDLLQQ